MLIRAARGNPRSQLRESKQASTHDAHCCHPLKVPLSLSLDVCMYVCMYECMYVRSLFDVCAPTNYDVRSLFARICQICAFGYV